MAHLYRFFGELTAAGKWQMDEDEVVHALKVLRLVDGSVIEMMDGCGNVGTGPMTVESKSKASMLQETNQFTAKDLATRCIMIGALKPGDVDDLIAPLIELGADRIIVFRQEDTPHFRLNEAAAQRWHRLMRSALKQSKRAWTVPVEAVESLEGALLLVASYQHKWMLTPDAVKDLQTLSATITELVSAVALIGGEKGLSPKEEVAAKASGFLGVRLGPWILRARTAAPAAAVFLGMLPRPK
jgi:16S rRNA (uracil1498-N3)-methyltransferase